MENQEILSEFKHDQLQINTEFKIDDKTKKWVKGVLTSSVATLTFTKKDGTERVMKCTLRDDILPKVEVQTESTRAKSEDSLAVWDVEANGWRAFRWDSLKNVYFVLE